MVENRREKDKRFYFSRGQMVLLGGAFALASVVIFFLGVFTGKGIEERRLVKTEESPVKIPVKPSVPAGAGAPQGGEAKDEMTFYNTLTKPTGAEPSVEQKPKETKPAEKTAKAEAKESKAQAKESKPQIKEAPPAPKPVEKKAEKTPPAAPKPAPPVESAGVKESGKGWTVQVNAFPDEKSAKTWVDRLKNKGYNAYVTEVNVKGKSWYRVRVGQYSTREEAKKVEEVLKTKENYSKAFIASR